MISEIDYSILVKMIISGANNLSNNKTQVDALNVFPVPDGDTGTNMSMTFMSAAKDLLKESPSSVSDVANAVASATLRGARGNSGVILSQIFRGFATGVKNRRTIDTFDLACALQTASETAYRAVMKPTEGTILTVIKSCANAAEEIVSDTDDILVLLTHVCKIGNDALSKTPEMLPALKQAGVVDAGGMGLMLVFEGMLYALTNNNTIELLDPTEQIVAVPSFEPIVGDIEFSYCTEFIINKHGFGTKVEKFKQAISSKGDCIVVIDDLDVVKVHIHTNNPGFVIEQAIKLGELINIKIDNMKQQHNTIIEQDVNAAPHKEYGIIAVANGAGITKMLKDAGADVVIEGGQTMNPSADDILKAINSLNAGCVYILPNNSNIILTAEQAGELSKNTVITVPTKSIPQGFSSLMAFDPNSSGEDNLSSMSEALKNVKTGLITFAVRDTVFEEKEIKEGDILGLLENKIALVGQDCEAVALELISKMTDEDSSYIMVLYGEDISEENAGMLVGKVEKAYPNCDVAINFGGQPIYSYIISVE